MDGALLYFFRGLVHPVVKCALEMVDSCRTQQQWAHHEGEGNEGLRTAKGQLIQ